MRRHRVRPAAPGGADRHQAAARSNVLTSRKDYGVRSGRPRDQRAGNQTVTSALLRWSRHRARGDPRRGCGFPSGHGLDHRPRGRSRHNRASVARPRAPRLAAERWRPDCLRGAIALRAALRRAALTQPRARAPFARPASACMRSSTPPTGVVDRPRSRNQYPWLPTSQRAVRRWWHSG